MIGMQKKPGGAILNYGNNNLQSTLMLQQLSSGTKVTVTLVMTLEVSTKTEKLLLIKILTIKVFVLLITTMVTKSV